MKKYPSCFVKEKLLNFDILTFRKILLGILFKIGLILPVCQGQGFEWVVPPRYQDLGKMSDGLIPAQKNGLWGYVDLQGNVKIEFQYDQTAQFTNGFGQVVQNKLCGLINTEGDFVVEPKYDRMEGHACMKNGFYVIKDELWGIIENIHELVEPRYDHIDHFRQGYAIVSRGERYGMINTEGTEIASPQYEVIYDFSAETRLAAVKLHNKWGFMDETGALIIPCQYEEVGSFSEQLAQVKRGGKWGFINAANGIVIPFQYEDAYAFVGGLAAVKQQGLYGFLNKRGQWVIPRQFEEVTNFEDGFAMVKKNGKYGVINARGQQIIAPSFEEYIYGYEEKERHHFYEGIADVKQNGKWGFINTQGQWVCKPQFDQVVSFKNGFAMVKSVTHWGLINRKGQLVVPLQYEEIWHHEKQPSFLIVKQHNQLYGILDTLGRTVLSAQFGGINELEGRYFAAKKGNLWGIARLKAVAPPPIAEKRIALLIGNTQYHQIRKLGNQPLNDATDMSIALSAVGFDTMVVRNAGQAELKAAIERFTQRLKKYDVGLFYYAGHGIGINGLNYLVPIDFDRTTPKNDAPNACISLDWVQQQLQSAGPFDKTNILIVDACRDSKGLRLPRGLGVEATHWSMETGWSPPVRIPTGFITCYAVPYDREAENGFGQRNGIYTGILLKHLLTPQLKIEDMFKCVRIELKELGEQVPEELSTLTKTFYFKK